MKNDPTPAVMIVPTGSVLNGKIVVDSMTIYGMVIVPPLVVTVPHSAAAGLGVSTHTTQNNLILLFWNNRIFTFS
jgi:hypothetical protein